MLFHEALAKLLVQHGVTTVFGLVGEGNLFLMDSFRRQPGARYVSVANEASAVAAATGFWQVSGQLGVASVTHGPALTNTITTLVEAVKAKAPVVLVAGDTPTGDLENFQNVPQRELVVATGAGFEQVQTPDALGVHLAAAVHRAWTEHRPVVLNIPAEFQWAEVGRMPAAPSLRPPPAVVSPNPEGLDAAVGLIANARRPLVLAGRGACDRASRAALIRLAERIGAPLATTLRAKDLFRDEPGDLGVFGTLADERALEVIGKSDCILAFGAELNRWTTGEGSLLAGKRVLHVDIEPRNLRPSAAIDVSLVASAATAAATIVELLDDAGAPTRTFAGELAAPSAPDARAVGHPRVDDEPIDLATALRMVEEWLPVDRTIVLDTGRFILTAFTSLSVPEPRRFVHTSAFAAIGLGLPTAIGAAVGAPTGPVLAVCGDGGFMLGGLTELLTAVRHELDMVVLVLNDGSYGAEYVQMEVRGLDPTITVFDWPDLGPVAQAMGASGATVRTSRELAAALKSVGGRRPVLIDVKLDPARVPMPGGAH